AAAAAARTHRGAMGTVRLARHGEQRRAALLRSPRLDASQRRPRPARPRTVDARRRVAGHAAGAVCVPQASPGFACALASSLSRSYVNTESLVERLPAPVERAPTGVEIRTRVLAYYNAATTDYRAWSREFNMHFGYWRPGLNPFRREPMLHELNLQALARLNLPTDRPARLADLGGGTGATARAGVAAYPNLSVDVVSLVPKQVTLGRAANAAVPRGDAISM